MFEVDWKTPHLWRKTVSPRKTAPALTGDISTDVLIVGGGFTGMAAALGARDSGVNVVLLEGNEIGSAASGRNNGLVISHHSKASPSEYEATYGKAYGERYNRTVADAAGVAFGLMQRFNINAHQVQEGWIQPAHTRRRSLARGPFSRNGGPSAPTSPGSIARRSPTSSAAPISAAGRCTIPGTSIPSP